MNSRSLIALLLLLPACAQEQAAVPPAIEGVDDAVWANYQPLPDSMPSATNPSTPEKVTLGRMLYYDTRFSQGGAVSCYVCHPLHDYGTSHRPTGIGHDAEVGGRNEPTPYNAALQIAQFWDGRAPDVEAQALGPVLNPAEMGMANADAVIKVLKSMPAYQDAFHAAFPADQDPVTFENFGKAIGAFERGLLLKARWDEFLAGNPDAITAEEKAGFKEFAAAGCTTCHTGPLVGGSMYQKVGLVQPRFTTRDEGRFNDTGNAAGK
ncbi:MAG: cytochrome-c peroxidase, partial [Gemmatimonadetes bacterium]|nr:cytochrome-c peroxidase [Gemmatimonadota bacterium]